VNIFITDDQEKDRNLLAEYILKMSIRYNFEYETKLFDSGEELLEYYEKLDISPGIILLDIEMDGISGFKTAEILREKKHYEGQLIFFTNHSQFVLDSFDVGADQYLVKPITYQTFEKKVYPLIRKIDTQKNYMFVKLIDGGNQVMALRDICAVCVEPSLRRGTLTVHTMNGEVSIYGLMKDYVQKLSPYSFFQIHRQCLVNLEHVQGLYPEGLLMKNGNHYQISRYQKKELTNQLMEMAALQF